nr:hypothetical protein [Tanacetum cinerariifolium]
MSLTFADTHNMVAYLNKSDVSEGFNQVIDFLNASYIKYALTINPHIYVSCIKQFWNTVVVKQTNDVSRLQALVDKKKVVITEATIRDSLRLDDAEGVDCLPNEEIFAELACMGYEKPSTKLTFYKAFFSSQWKFLIHTILQSMSAKRPSWNEFSSAMAYAIICLSTGRKFNFSKYIFESLKVFANMRRVGKGFSKAETPLFEDMLVGVIKEEGDAEEQVQDDVDDAATQVADTVVQGDDVHEPSIPSPTLPTPPPQQPQDLPSTSQVKLTLPQSPQPQPQSQPQAQQPAADFLMSLLQEALDACASSLNEMIDALDSDAGVALMDDKEEEKKAKKDKVAGDDQVQGRQAEIYKIDMDHASKVLSMQEDEPEEVQEVVDVVTTAKLFTEVVTDASKSVTAASITISTAELQVPVVAITTAAPSKDKGKGIMVEEPKPLKKKQQVEIDEEYARKLHEELNKDIDWNVAIDHVKQKAKEDPFVQRYQVMKKRPQTEAQARKNIIMYLKNVAGFRLDYFKGMSYDDICPIFKAKFNSNIEFLLKTKEQIEEEENRAIQSINETLAQKSAKRRKLNEEVENLKRHLEIMPNEDDDVYTKATPLARKVPVMDYEIINLNNKPYYKIIRADGTHQLYVSCIKQFWNTVIVKQTNDVTRLQALVDKKKVVITEATIRYALRLGYAEGVDCLPNEEIFAELARMSYEKPSTKLTFYKDFFSCQWKFLIHTILQSLSAKRTSWNEFSSVMASAVICLSTGRKFNFSKYIFKSLVRNVDNSSKFYVYPRGWEKDSGVDTPLFEGMLVGVIKEQGDAAEQVQDDVADAAAQGADTVVQGDDVHEPSIPSPTPPTLPPQQSQDLPSIYQEALDACGALTRRVEHLEYDKVAQALEITKLKRRVKKLERGNKVKVLKLRRLKKERMIDDLDKDDAIDLMDGKGEEKKEEEEDEPEVQEVVDVVTTGKLITKVATGTSESVTVASTTIAIVEPQVLAATITAAPVRVAAISTRRRKGVVIRDPEEESTTIIPADTKSKDKGKGIVLHEELNKDIDRNAAIDHVNQKAKEDPFVQRYQVIKKRPQTEAQSQRNMIMYLKNVAGFRLDYFKGMSYDDIRPIFEAKFNSNTKFLLKTKEQLDEEENRAIQSINETPAQKAAKRRKLNEEVEDLKQTFGNYA